MKKFSIPSMELVKFTTNDVIVTSGCTYDKCTNYECKAVS